MPAKAGQIVIDVSAGTAKMVVDLEAAKGKLRELGTQGQGSARIINAEMRLLEGNIFNNNRAAAAFLLQFPAIAKAANAAFAVFGVVALVGVIGEATVKVRDYFKELRDGPEKTRGAFGELNSSIRLSNDALAVANDRLENDIAKLEGHRQNTLKLALDESKQAADELAASLAKDIAAVDELLRKQPGTFAAALSGKAGTDDIAKELGGNTGFGGFRGKVAKTTDPAKLRSAYDEELRIFKSAIIQAEAFKKDHQGADGIFGINGEAVHGNVDDRIEVLKATLLDLQQQSDSIDQKSTNTALTKKKEALTAAAENAGATKPFTDRIKELGAKIDEARAKFDAIGKSESAQILSKAFGETQKVIADVNKELEKHHLALNAIQKAQILDYEAVAATSEVETEWANKYAASTVAVGDRITSLQAMTAAIGAGYEATKKANVETRLAVELGQHANDPDWLRAHVGEVSNLRTGLSIEESEKSSNAVAKSLQSLNDQIDLERELARVVSEGAEAIRLATLAQKTAMIARENDVESARKLIAAETALSVAARDRASAKVADKINEEIEATERLTDATLKGAAAVRQARLENELAKIRSDQGGSGGTVPGVFGVSPAELDAAALAEKQHNLDLANARKNTDPVNRIDDEIAALKEAQAILGDTLAIQIKLRDLENERLHALAQETLQQRTASAGVRAFFLEMQTQAKSTADIIYETLNSVVDRTSDNLAKLATEKHKKGDDHAVSKAFGAEFTDIGREALGSSIKSTLHTALGKLGKADGSDANPFSVIVKNKGASGPLGSDPGLAELGDDEGGSSGGGFLGKLGGLFGGGLGMIKNFIPHLAGGGSADPGSIYRVAEAGEGELITPKNSSTVTPLSKLGGGGDIHITNHIDARGAELGVENRIHRVVEQAHASAVAQSLHASKEQARRTPQRRG